MTKEEAKQIIELAALGCLDKTQYKSFIETISNNEELKDEFGKYQKMVSLIPLSLKIEAPNDEIKNKVAFGIKKIIQTKSKEVENTLKKIETLEKKPSEINIPQNVEETTENYSAQKDIYENSQIEQKNLIDENLKPPQESDTEEQTYQTAFSEKDETIDSSEKQLNRNKSPEVKMMIDYSPNLKEEVADEVTKRIKKTFNYQLEDFESKLNKKIKTIKILLTLIIILLITFAGFNSYLMYIMYSDKGNNVEIKNEMVRPPNQLKDSL